MTDTPILCLIRRDLRLDDNPMLSAAAETGRPVIPVFILEPSMEQLGAAPLWRLGLGVDAFASTLAGIGSALVLRRGAAAQVIDALLRETGADTVLWARNYEADAIARDRAIKSDLTARGVTARSFPGALLFEPWTVKTGQGGFYRVYSPYWRAVRGLQPGAPLAPARSLRAPAVWPESDRLEAWGLGRALHRGAKVVGRFAHVGQDAAQARLDRFLASQIGHYKADRDFLDRDATSGLSENLTYGEISPRRIWAAGHAALEHGAPGAEHFLKELVWREFAWHLMYHTPHMTRTSWRPEWDSFAWTNDPDSPSAMAWKQGRTGVAVVDAAMRELYVTGTMHNRARMIVASYLTKNLGLHWKIGMNWFADTLIDWDPASNAMGWQWVAGSGPDAAPYFRVFNPETQAEKFDKLGIYRRRWLAEGQAHPPDTALAFYDAIPRSWAMTPGDRPARLPPGALADSRRAALARYEAWKAARAATASAG